MISRHTPQFPAGQILITTSAQQQLRESDVRQSLRRHLAGDWGDCEPEDAAENDETLLQGERLLSVDHTAAVTL